MAADVVDMRSRSPLAAAPAAQKTLRHVESLARIHTATAITNLVNIMQDTKAPAAARVSAATVILDRGWGKARQHVQVDSGVGSMSDEELAAAIQQEIRKLSDGDEDEAESDDGSDA